MNQQPISTVEEHNGDWLAVHSIFSTIQGEGPFSGERAVFIRLGGCNLRCPGCDTDYTEGALDQTVRGIINAVKIKSAQEFFFGAGDLDGYLVVITGGEPFRQPIEKLVRGLLHEGCKVQLETNGTLYRPLPWRHGNLHVVCSPKTRNINTQLAPHIGHFKYVAKAGNLADDGLPIQALDHPVKDKLYRPEHPCEIYLQPMDEKDEEKNRANLEAVKKSVMKYGYRLCLQTHKIIGVE